MAAMSTEAELQIALRVVTMPMHTNRYGTIFGGVILSWIDQAGFIEARHFGLHRWVTVSIEKVDFVAPVYVGDVVSFLTRTESTGRTSVKVRVQVVAERFETGETIKVTDARLTMVAIDENGKSIPYESPPTLGPDSVE
jgi:acyl-CoA thioesterase YciA